MRTNDPIVWCTVPLTDNLWPARMSSKLPPERAPAAARGRRAFDGLGVGFDGPQGTATLRNPSDNSLAVGPDHIVQIVNSRMAIFTKKGGRYKDTGRALYGPVNTNNVFRGFGGPCESAQQRRRRRPLRPARRSLADRHADLSRARRRGPTSRRSGPQRAGAYESPIGRPNQPGAAVPLYQPPQHRHSARHPAPAPGTRGGPQAPRRHPALGRKGPYAMCYAVSTSPDPLGPYYRYEFLRPLFPDYPRPAVWPDGYYVPTSTGDDVIEKHACVVERERDARRASRRASSASSSTT